MSTNAATAMAESWFLHVLYDRVTRTVIRDCVKLDSLEQALEVLLPAHVEKGWKIREEIPGHRHGVTVLKVWKPYVDANGRVQAKLVYPKHLPDPLPVPPIGGKLKGKVRK